MAGSNKQIPPLGGGALAIIRREWIRPTIAPELEEYFGSVHGTLWSENMTPPPTKLRTNEDEEGLLLHDLLLGLDDVQTAPILLGGRVRS